MTRIPLPRLALAFALAPLALGLAACSKGDDKAAAGGEPIAKVAPPAGKAWTEVVTKTADGGYVITCGGAARNTVAGSSDSDSA